MIFSVRSKWGGSDEKRFNEIKNKAEQGDYKSQYEIGRLCDLGRVYAPITSFFSSKKESAKWYMKSAEQGYSKAQFQIGMNYIIGDVVRKNYREAVTWLEFAAEQGHVGACDQLAGIYEDIDGRSRLQDYKESLKWYTTSSKLGGEGSNWQMGRLYEQGRIVSIDYVKAYMYYHIEQLGNGYGNGDYGVKDRDRLSQIMAFVQIEESKKLAIEWMLENRLKPGFWTGVEIVTGVEKINGHFWDEYWKDSIQACLKKRGVVSKEMTDSQLEKAEEWVRKN